MEEGLHQRERENERESSCLILVVFHPAVTLNAGLRPSASSATAHSLSQLGSVSHPHL